MAPATGKSLHAVHRYQGENYRGYRIYGTARQFGGYCTWVAEGILFSNQFPDRVRKLHRIKARPNGCQFVNRESAEEYALRLCRLWVDRKRAGNLITELNSDDA